jgi:NADH-quinone oxidoreductase subunit I
MNYTGYPTIEIDASKCTIPFACKKCLEICPQAVFNTFGIKVEKGRETDPNDPGAYGLRSVFPDKCTGCDDCIEVCPEDAITITFPEMEA